MYDCSSHNKIERPFYYNIWDRSGLEKILQLTEIITNRARKALQEGNFSTDDYNDLHNTTVLLLSEVVNISDLSKPTKNEVNYPFTPYVPSENDFGYQNYKSNPNYNFDPYAYPPSDHSQKLVNKTNGSITTTMSDVYTVPPEIYTTNPSFIPNQNNNINFNDNNRKNKLNNSGALNNQAYPQIQVNFNFSKPLQVTENNIIDVNNQVDTFIPIPTNFMSSSNLSSPALSINPNSLHMNDMNNLNNSSNGSDVSSSPESPSESPTSQENKRKRKMMSKNQNLSCFICHETVTPEWRKGPDGNHTLCNACGLNYAKKIKFERQNLERQGRRKQSIDIILNYKKFHFSKQIEEERAKKFEKKRSLSPLYQSNDIMGSPYSHSTSNPNLSNSGNSFNVDNSLSTNLQNILSNSGFANNSLSEALNNILQSSSTTPTNNNNNNSVYNNSPNNNIKPNNNNYQNMMYNNFQNNNTNNWEGNNTLIFDNSTPYHYAVKKENHHNNDFNSH